MNEIHISIPYSFFAELFGEYIHDNFNRTKSHRLKAIDQIKKYWLLLDTEQREFIVKQTQKQACYYGEFKTLLGWITEQQNQRQPTAQPLNAFVELPIKQMEKVK